MTAVLDRETAHLTHERPALGEVKGIPFTRLVRVELRKMTDTRAGRWMLIVMAAISLLVVSINLIWGSNADQTFGTFLGLTSFPLMILLPIVGIMAATANGPSAPGWSPSPSSRGGAGSSPPRTSPASCSVSA